MAVAAEEGQAKAPAPSVPGYDLLVRLIKDLGLPVGLVVYYVFKDWVFTSKLLESLTLMQTTLDALKLAFMHRGV